MDKILPKCRYFAYVQVAEPEQNLWEEYQRIVGEVPHFAMRKADRGLADLSGVPRAVPQGRSVGMSQHGRPKGVDPRLAGRHVAPGVHT